MNILFSLLLILIIGFIGSKLSFFKLRLPVPASFFLSGDEYIILGLLIGPGALNLIDREMLLQLNPLINLLLGWIGFLYGLQFEWLKIRRIPAQFFLMSFFLSLAVFILVFTSCFYFLTLILRFQADRQLYVGLITLSAIASVSSPTSVALFMRDSGITKKDFQFLQFVSSTDGVLGICVFGIMFAYFNPTAFSTETLISSVEWVVVSVVLGVGFALLFRYIILHSVDMLEIEILTIGMLIFSGGLCGYLRLSPLFTNFILGVAIANFGMLNRNKVFRTIARFEHSFYITLLVLAGCVWVPGFSMPMLVFASAYVILRLLSKVFSAFSLVKMLRLDEEFSLWQGFGLIAQGGLAVAMIMNFQQMYQNNWTGLVLNVGILSILVNQAAGVFFLKRFSKKV